MNGSSFGFCNAKTTIPPYRELKFEEASFNCMQKKARDQRYLLLVLVFVLLVTTHPNAFAQSQLDYAHFLMNDQDYFRAISVYKEVMYFSDDAETKNFCLLQI